MYDIDTDLINVALNAGLVLTALVILLMLQVIIMRMRTIQSRKLRYKLLQKWRPMLTAVVLGNDFKKLKVPNKHKLYFLLEWNKYYSIVKGNHLDALIRMMHRLHFGYYARKLMRSRNVRKRLFGITTLGHMREYAAWDELVELLTHPHTMLSLTAARALIQIDAKPAIELLLPKILERDDWPWANVAYILKQAPTDLLCNRLAETVLEAPVNKQASILRLLEQTRCLQLTSVSSKILAVSNEDHIITVCLHINTDPEMIDIVRSYCSHARWHVRMHAATALGRIGEKEDINRLLELTRDNEWWVRYRSAIALANLPSVDDEKLSEIINNEKDRFSKDILMQTRAEKLNNVSL